MRQNMRHDKLASVKKGAENGKTHQPVRCTVLGQNYFLDWL
jgi:hypothetical protein